MSRSNIRILPLGGLGEIGRNCTVIECGDDILVIDAGLMFPEEDMLGVDLVIPDFTYVLENRDKVRGIIITHGHEDHIGGLAFLLRELEGVPVYATPLTRGLIETKLKSHGLLRRADLHTILPGQQVDLGPYDITPFHVNHSIPDAVGYAIRTPLGLIVHTGDFKIDHTPIEGRTTDLAALSKLANEGVMVLLADSTNAESPGYTLSERRLVDSFERAFTQAHGRVIVATFASLLSRVQLVIETAARFGRKIAIAGRSMEESTAIAESLGYVAFPPGTRVQLNEVNNLPDEQVCILATGSQGEPNAALARMAAGRFRFVQIRDGDTIILSSKAIPGNETAIHRNIDNLFRRGANVIYGEGSGMHVSGHAAQEELKLMLNLLRPLYFVPVHGAYRMLHSHANLAYAMGYPREDVFILNNGQGVELTESGAHLSEPLELSPVYVDGSLVGDVGATMLRDRKALSQDGFVVARVALQSGQVVDDPEIISQGFVYVPESAELLRSAESAILETIQLHGRDCRNAEEIEQRIKRRLESLFYDETRRRPVVIPMVTAS